MSDKYALIELIQKLPDDISTADILAYLQEKVGPTPAASAAEVDWDADELSEEEWRQFVAHSMRDELNDAREDIYTSEEGEQENGKG
jgi:hypothetical protein